MICCLLSNASLSSITPHIDLREYGNNAFSIHTGGYCDGGPELWDTVVNGFNSEEYESEEEQNDFNIKVKLELDGVNIIDMLVNVLFTGGEMSGKLSAKHKFELASNFNYILANKIKGSEE